MPTAPLALALLLPAAPVADAPADAAAVAAADRVDFRRDVRPILSDRCFTCHGNDAGTRPSDFRLDLKESAFLELDQGGHAIVAGDPDHSVLLERVGSDDEYVRMPPPGEGDPLTPAEIDTLRRWVAQGAEWSQHWAFVPPVRPAVPAVRGTRGEGRGLRDASEKTSDSTLVPRPSSPPQNPIDAFVRDRLVGTGLTPSEEADRTALIRRVTYSLTGLPPTPGEVDRFLNDTSPDAYERVVDRLLASPRYGEHRARYWLDAARYGDTHGLHLDNRREIWPYRDWVVRSFNRNQPFDEFTRWQIAGDLLPGPKGGEPPLEQLVATGFNRCNVTTSEGGSIDEEVRVRYVVDRTETVGTVFLGLTVGCAACHDHKFDPVSQREFYELTAFYNSAQDAAMDKNESLPPPAVRVSRAADRQELADIAARLERAEHGWNAYVAGLEYPAAVDSPGGATSGRGDYVWVDDATPGGAKRSGDAGGGGVDGWRWTNADDGPVFSGNVALFRQTRYQAQSLFTDAQPPLVVRDGDVLFVHVYTASGAGTNAGTLMFQVHTLEHGWNHRAVWGKDQVDFGTKGTPSRLRVGGLPPRDEWVRLSVPAADIGLKPGDRIDGLAFTQKGGKVYWDAAGVETDGAADLVLAEARAAWESAVRATDTVDRLPPAVAAAFAAAERTDEQRDLLAGYFRTAVHDRVRSRLATYRTATDTLRARRSAVEARLPSTLVMRDAADVRQAYILNRGEYDQRGEPVSHGVPSVLPPLPEDAPKNRAALAEWLTDPGHPLTARVTVNRIWQQHFGTGLVKTSEDFGNQGEWPSHPELLDWLAVDFAESGWDVKRLHRLIVTSATFRQDAAASPGGIARDPENRLLSRGPRYRLDAESIRDTALAASGLLVPEMGGPGVKPYQPAGLWEAVGYTDSNTAKFTQDHGDDLYRRSLYTFWKRTSPPPGLSTFDAPTRESCTVRRSRTNTPLQALTLMNDVQFVEAGRHLAARMLREADVPAGATDDERRAAVLTRGVRLVLGRSPSADELDVLAAAHRRLFDGFRADPGAAAKLLSVGESPRDADLDPAEHAAATMAANLLLNLDEAVTK